LATKFEAYNNRGSDYRLSHDIEDIIYVLDNRIDIVNEVMRSPIEIIDFLKAEFTKIISGQSLIEVLSAHIHPLVIEERLAIVEEKIQNIITL